MTAKTALKIVVVAVASFTVGILTGLAGFSIQAIVNSWLG